MEYDELGNLLDQLSRRLPSKLMDRVSEALAARQPVGEAVGTIRDRDGVFEIELSESAHDTEAGALDGRSVYIAAPPAQQPVQVDLEQFREAVHDQYWYVLERHGSESERVEAERERNRLLALIDAQAK